jgi:hypothetical protein
MGQQAPTTEGLISLFELPVRQGRKITGVAREEVTDAHLPPPFW